MAETRELLDRIASFRHKLASTPPVAVEFKSPAAPAPKPVLQSPPPQAPAAPAPPPVLTSRAQRLLVEARELVAKQKQLAAEPLLQSTQDSLAAYHRGTVGLTDSALRLAQQLPTAVDMQLVACEGLEHLLKVIDQRNDSLQQALRTRSRDGQRIDRLTSLYATIRSSRPLTLNPLVDFANELLDESRRGAKLHWLDPVEEAGPHRSVERFLAAHALNVAAIVARLLPHDFEWAAKPVLPVLAALVMDVGLSAAPPSLIFTDQAYGVEERRKIELHCREGSDLIRRTLPDSGPLADLVLAHHERPDGTGYPNGLKGEMIPTLARMLAVADTYAALVTPRPHRVALETRAALTEVLAIAEQGKLDRDFAEYLLNLSFHPVGTVVELVDGRLAVVAAIHGRRVDTKSGSRPVVAILTDADGSVRPRPDFLDLAASDLGGILRSLTKTEARSKLAEWYPEYCV
jgi:HD-GYP domain-containing protein (c-di-GMP phosphodiesterase class II)